MKRRSVLGAFSAAYAGFALGSRSAAAAGPTAPVPAELDALRDYLAYNAAPRDIDPADYVAYLRSQSRFRFADLAAFPKHAIVLHDSHPEEQLDRIGVRSSEYVSMQTGDTDPNLLYIVNSATFATDFVLNRGLPGAGGITTQVAELYALGVTHVTHIGTCGLIGSRIPGGLPIVSAGSVKDAAGVMLSRDPRDRFGLPDAALRTALATAFQRSGTAFTQAVGYTSPIYYFQSKALVHELATRPALRTIEYVEMEAGSLFALAALMQRAAASVIVGVDRYTVDAAGVGKHQYLDVDENAAKATILRTVVEAYATLG